MAAMWDVHVEIRKEELRPFFKTFSPISLVKTQKLHLTYHWKWLWALIITSREYRKGARKRSIKRTTEEQNQQEIVRHISIVAKPVTRAFFHMCYSHPKGRSVGDVWTIKVHSHSGAAQAMIAQELSDHRGTPKCLNAWSKQRRGAAH